MMQHHRPPHRHGDNGEPEPGGMPVEPGDGAPEPGVPSDPEPDGTPAPPAA